MATYIQGVNGYVPQVQPFTPDFNFYSGVLSTKQSQYDAARDELSTLYGSLLNSEMLRSDNIEEREAFFKAIDQDIKKLSGIDLSLRQNQTAGKRLFNQLLDNKYIVKDMAWTKNWRAAQSRGEALKYCTDSEKCGGEWWDGGDRILQYKAQEFATANRDETLGFGDAKYVAYQDVFERGLKMMKDSGFEIKSDSMTPDGRYRVTTVNGEQAKVPLLNFMGAAMGRDPMMLEYAEGKAYLTRKDWVSSNAYLYGSEEGAEQEYVNQLTRSLSSKINETEKQIGSAEATATRTMTSLRGNANNAPYSSYVEQIFNEANGVMNVVNEAKASITDSKNTLKSAISNRVGKNVLTMLDKSYASILLNQEFSEAANVLAYRNYSQTIKADEFALARHNHDLAMRRIAYQQELKDASKAKDRIAKDESEAFVRGLLDGISTTVPNPDGNNINKDNVEVVREAVEKSNEDKFRAVGGLAYDMFDSAFAYASRDGFSSQSTNDLVEMVGAAVNSGGDTTVKRLWNGFSDSEKVNYIKNEGVGLKRFFSPENADVLVNVYNDVLKPAILGTDKTTLSARPYWREMINSPSVAMRMSAAEAAVEADKIIDNTVSGWRGSLAESKKEYRSLLDDKGNIIPKERYNFILKSELVKNGAERDYEEYVKAVQAQPRMDSKFAPISSFDEYLDSKVAGKYDKLIKSFNKDFNDYTQKLPAADLSMVVGIGSHSSNVVSLNGVNLASGGPNAITVVKTLSGLQSQVVDSQVNSGSAVRVGLGGSGLPKVSDSDAIAAYNSLLSAAIQTELDPSKAGKNPLFSMTAETNVGPNGEYTKYNFKVNGSIDVKNILDKDDGVFTKKSFYKNGIDVYIPTALDNTPIGIQSKRTSFDTNYKYKGNRYDFPNYDKKIWNGTSFSTSVNPIFGVEEYNIFIDISNPYTGDRVERKIDIPTESMSPTQVFQMIDGQFGPYSEAFYSSVTKGGVENGR